MQFTGRSHQFTGNIPAALWWLIGGCGWLPALCRGICSHSGRCGLLKLTIGTRTILLYRAADPIRGETPTITLAIPSQIFVVIFRSWECPPEPQGSNFRPVDIIEKNGTRLDAQVRFCPTQRWPSGNHKSDCG